MSDFKTTTKKLNHNTIPAEDDGISMRDALALIQGQKYEAEVYGALGIEQMLDDTLLIPGATSLVNSVLQMDSLFEKFDLQRRYEDITFRPSPDENYREKDIEIGFAENEHAGAFFAAPAYVAQSSFLEYSGNMSKYANTLIGNERIDMVFNDLEQIRTIYNANTRERIVANGDLKDHEYKYRIIRNIETGQYYYRALTSINGYKDYNIRISLFVALVAIHRISQEGDSYMINRAEHTDSRIKVYFEKTGQLTQTPLGLAKFLIELRNNEVRQGAVKLSGVCAIVYENNGDEQNGDEQNAAVMEEVLADYDEYEDEFSDDDTDQDEEDIYLTPRPNRLRYKIESIAHNVTPPVALPRMLAIDQKVRNVEQMIYSDLDIAGDIKTLDTIVEIIESKVKAIQKNSQLGRYKSTLQRLIPESVDNLAELLRLVNKLNLVIPEKNVDAKEYLRYLFFEAIVERKRPGFSQTDANEEEQ